MHDNAIELRKSLFPCRIAMAGNCRRSPSVLHAARRFPTPSRASLGQVPSHGAPAFFIFQPRSNNRHRSRYASRQAAGLDLAPIPAHPDTHRGASRRLLTTPSRPRSSATRSSAKPSSKRQADSRAADPLQQALQDCLAFQQRLRADIPPIESQKAKRP
jgi:hypothetical protein